MLISVNITYKQSSCSLCEIGYRLFRDLNDLIKLNVCICIFFHEGKVPICIGIVKFFLPVLSKRFSIVVSPSILPKLQNLCSSFCISFFFMLL